MFIDTHTHLYDEQFTADFPAVITRALNAGVQRMYMPNCDSNTIAGMMQIAADYPGHCLPMMGLHPCYVKEDFEKELAIVEKWLGDYSFAGVGEVGLDYYWDLTFRDQQKIAFEQQIDWALQAGLPVIIHSRESTQDCIDIVRKKQNGNLKGIFHCFGGTLEEAQQIIEAGFYLGIGGVATFKKSSLPEVLEQVSLEHIVLETDAPYLAPVPYRGKRNECSYIPLIADKISDIKQVLLPEVERITTENAKKIFAY